MHAFWSVLLIPLFVIAAYMTVRSTSRSALKLSTGTAAGIWRMLFVLATVLLVLYLSIDIVMWIRGASGIQISPYSIFMRAVFGVLTATDCPVLQIWVGTMIGWGYTLRAAKADSLPRAEQSVEQAGDASPV